MNVDKHQSQELSDAKGFVSQMIFFILCLSVFMLIAVNSLYSIQLPEKSDYIFYIIIYFSMVYATVEFSKYVIDESLLKVVDENTIMVFIYRYTFIVSFLAVVVLILMTHL